MSKHVLIGITGGIAAYKSCDLIHQLEKVGFETKVMITCEGLKFVTPLTLQTLSKHPVYQDEFSGSGDPIHHISLAEWADLCVIAPLSANSLAKIAHGLADNLLTTTVLSLPETTPLVLAPAMNTRMWNHPATQQNLKLAKKFYPQCITSGPRVSRLACNQVGMGAMSEISDLLDTITTHPALNEA